MWLGVLGGACLARLHGALLWHLDSDSKDSRLHGFLAFGRELWYRASLAWQSILTNQTANAHSLVVAHNAVNQASALVCLGFKP
jgi:hypothetical protein